MKNDFFIKLAKKDEKMTLLKIATLLCFIVHTMMLANSESIHLVHYYIGEYERASIFYLMDYPMYFLSYSLVYFLLENILIIIYLKFKVNGEIDKFFKLNYILLILTMGFYSLSTIFMVSFIISIYKCFEFAKTFSKNKKNLLFSILGFFTIFFTSMLLSKIDNFLFRILILLLGILAMSSIYLYNKKINKVPSLNYVFLLLTEICFWTRILSDESVNFIGLLLLIITIIVNLRVIFPKIKSYTNFSKIQKIIIIIGILFSLFSKVYIIKKQEQIETISKQESDTNNSNENNTLE
ncbi:hypothetical protein BCB68_00885 [Leptotrichia sp. oral taxon 498]|uniref:hypothetical protein n=1 Tax=Leptotrichia sp. oral taxon 498 TaxID=712368 RepID=UPI000B8CF8AB|nr:hypothetical protein [Leptotrichia sp. oral taxon 498]ASQ47648.1 hypothetical protein BCB68_00885 [Leptotrichia sp. oral taxon 498]